MRPGQWQGDGEGAARTGRAAHRQPTCHALDEGAGDGQAEAGAAVAPGGPRVDLAKGFEDVVELVLLDADTGVGDLEQHARTVVGIKSGGDGHFAPLGELDGIADQVDQHLLELVGVCLQSGQVVLDPGRQCQATGFCLHLHHVDQLGNQRSGAGGVDLQLHAPGLDLRQVENVVDQAEQVLAVAVNLLRVAELALPEHAIAVLLQDAGEADDGVQRRAQLVAHVGDELAAHAVRLHQFQVDLLQPYRLFLHGLVADGVVQRVGKGIDVSPEGGLDVVAQGMHAGHQHHAKRSLLEGDGHGEDAAEGNATEADVCLRELLHLDIGQPVHPATAQYPPGQAFLRCPRQRVGQVRVESCLRHRRQPATFGVVDVDQHELHLADLFHGAHQALGEGVDVHCVQAGEVVAEQFLDAVLGGQLAVAGLQLRAAGLKVRVLAREIADGCLDLVAHAVQGTTEQADGVAGLVVAAGAVVAVADGAGDAGQAHQAAVHAPEQYRAGSQADHRQAETGPLANPCVGKRQPGCEVAEGNDRDDGGHGPPHPPPAPCHRCHGSGASSCSTTPSSRSASSGLLR